MYTGTRLTTAIHRRLFSRFFLRGVGVCTQAMVKTFSIENSNNFSVPKKKLWDLTLHNSDEVQTIVTKYCFLSQILL